MATTYRTPGVYINEIATLPASVAQVETAIPAFVGLTESNGGGEPVRISSMVEFIENFGGPKDAMITINIDASDVVGSATVNASAAVQNLYYSMQLYFANGGGPCYVVSGGAYAAGAAVYTGFYGASGALAKIELEDEPTILVIPEAAYSANHNDMMQEMLGQCNRLQDRFAVFDLLDPANESTFRTGVGANYLKYGAAYTPSLVSSLQYDDASVLITFTGSASNVSIKTAFDTLKGAATGLSLSAIINAANDDNNVDKDEFVDLLNIFQGDIRKAISAVEITLPPSAAVAGVYASVDSDRGVWKAPANVSLNLVKRPAELLNNADQEGLNVDPNTGKSINAIRLFSGKGTLVWGARTLAGNDNEWRYVPVRRLFITIEESIKKATEAVVFEPNDKNTWERTRSLIQSYLTGLWRQGALAGAKPEDAFFINVGLGETMTPQDILEGRLIVEIGIAAVRPAEFIILNFSHKLQES